jgi:hypothetical protein
MKGSQKQDIVIYVYVIDLKHVRSSLPGESNYILMFLHVFKSVTRSEKDGWCLPYVPGGTFDTVLCQLGSS